jgi:hypothetical protein
MCGRCSRCGCLPWCRGRCRRWCRRDINLRQINRRGRCNSRRCRCDGWSWLRLHDRRCWGRRWRWCRCRLSWRWCLNRSRNARPRFLLRWSNGRLAPHPTKRITESRPKRRSRRRTSTRPSIGRSSSRTLDHRSRCRRGRSLHGAGSRSLIALHGLSNHTVDAALNHPSRPRESTGTITGRDCTFSRDVCKRAASDAGRNPCLGHL